MTFKIGLLGSGDNNNKNMINRELFEAWLLSQPRERTYNYMNCNDCLLCKFIKETTSCQSVHAGGCTITINEACVTLELWLANLLGGHSLRGLTDFGRIQDAYLKLFPDTLVDLSSTKMGATPTPVANELGTSSTQVVPSPGCDETPKTIA